MRKKRIEAVVEVVPELAPEHRAAVDAAIAAHRDLPGALLPILHAVQDALGWIPEGAVAPIASALNLSRAEVHGTISFYHDFRRMPPARHQLRVCTAEACQAMGARELNRHAERRIGASEPEITTSVTSATRNTEFMLEPVYCLGNCALAPAILLDGELHGRVTPERLDALLDACLVRDPVAA